MAMPLSQESLDLGSDDEMDLTPFPEISSKYITENDLGKFFKFNDTNALNLIHINARSLKKNFCHLETLLKNIPGQVSALAITETWLSESTSDLFLIPNYNFVSNPRSQKPGGGVWVSTYIPLLVSL